MATSKVNWDRVNWKFRDIDIAKKSNVSRERVRQKRRALGKPNALDYKLRDDSITRRNKAQKLKKKLRGKKLTINEIAAIFKIDRPSAYRLGIKYRILRVHFTRKD